MTTLNYRDILQQVIAFNTTSHLSNLQIIDYIKKYLDNYDISSTIFPNENGQKASLYATIGPATESGIGLSAHTDVVPVTGQEWATDPFTLTEKDQRLYGRGTCDMKGFLACVLAMVPEFKSKKLKMPIHLLFSYDEEIGCIGVRPMINKLGTELVKPKYVIVGEPTSMQVVDAHKGIQSYMTEVTGFEAHSSVPENGVNAINYANLLIMKLMQISEEAKSFANDRFLPSYSSIHIGTIEGGTARNIIPKKCRFFWEIRSLPGFNVQAVLDELNAYSEELMIDMRKTYQDASIITDCHNQVSAFATSDNKQGQHLKSLVMKWAGQNDTFAVSYATEAGLFETGGCPTVVCGPGNIEQAHKPDEYIEIRELEKCMQFLKKVSEYASN